MRFLYYGSDDHRDLHSFPTRRSSDLLSRNCSKYRQQLYQYHEKAVADTWNNFWKDGSAGMPRSEERFSRNAETDLVCRLLLEKKNNLHHLNYCQMNIHSTNRQIAVRP